MTDATPTPYLVKVPRRDPWHIRDGKKRISTGETDRSKATAVLMDYIGKRKGATRAAAGPSAGTVSDLLRAWADIRREENARSYETKWKYVVATIERHAGRLTLPVVDKAWSRRYAKARYAEGVAHATVRQELQVLSSAWKIARGDRATYLDLPDFVLPPPSDPRDVFLTKDEARALLAACEWPHIRLFIRIALATGGRPGAVLALKWPRVDFAAGIINLRSYKPSEAEHLKKAARVPIEEDVAEDLMAAREAAQTDHVVEFRGRPMKSVRKAFATVVEKVGLDPEVITPHVLRHSAATWMAQAGVDMWQIAGFLGHRDTTMVMQVYGHHHPDYMRGASRAVSLK
ncbi:tyrosine-type recombinase/integrase [Cereibacter azotoformans]|uniref:Site-specific recombinase XerD n=1 Tax=Cereibacter azotoformans TaxID=43057 RepID=A0A2T5JN26_9RHOB|nr:site-specific integrase [Cereibacter azotoformans]MBO4169562.1 site-specific integrase [Cereibacter azotoformans]PTR08720.1 site-specific recombinase XerD [Cereibacter azotoformans]